MNKIVLAFLIIGLMISTAACSNAKTSNVKATADVKSDDLLGKTFTVQGTVVNTVKIGSISGYKLQDATGTIDVSTKNLPKMNSTVTVTGVLQKSSYFGYYLVPNEN